MTVLFRTFKKKKSFASGSRADQNIEAQSGNENATIYNLNNNDMIIVNLAGFAWLIRSSLCTGHHNFIVI